MGRRSRRSDRWPRVLSEVTDRLVKRYGTPHLGNFEDPAREVFYILLSARTSETLYVRAFQALFAEYPTLASLSRASPRSVLKCVGGAGLGKKRSEQVVEVAKKLVADFGDEADAQLRAMSVTDVYNYLTSLPGVGPKSALCVMMWSLNVDVLPVDVNVQRIAARIGVIPGGLKHYQAQQLLPKFVPEGRSRDLHTVFMVHGRETCVPGVPKCGDCEIADLCRTGRKFLSQGREQHR